jgi:fructokinase
MIQPYGGEKRMNTLVTCMGESLIDFAQLNSVSHGEALPGSAPGTDFRMYPGGSLFNVAVGLARLGQHAAFAGKMAEDFFGHHLLRTLQAEGVDTRFVITTKGQSTLAFVTVEGGEPAFSFYGEGAADTLLTANDVPESLYQETTILHVGSISLLRGTTPVAILTAVERLKGKALLSLDPNIRADIIRDEPKYRALLQRLMMLIDVLKLSEADLAWLLPGATVEEALLHLCGLGPALVIITRGEKGAVARSGSSQSIEVPTIAVSMVDTVGAGDAFCAGTLAWLAERAVTTREMALALTGPELRSVLNFASAVAALNCAQAGANPPRRSELEQFIARLAL